GRDALVWSRTAELLGDIGRDFEGTQSRTRLAGTVGGNVDITTAGLTLLPGLDVTGDLRYIADDEATVAQTIEVGGTFIRAEALSPNVRVRGIRLLAQLVAVLAGLGVGLGLLWAVPR